MPTNKRESLIFTVIMCSLMVFGMSVYNVARMQGSFGPETFSEAWLGFPLAYVVAMACDWFIAGRLAKGFAFRFLVNPAVNKPLTITLAVSCCMVVPMVVLMSLYGAFEALAHTGATLSAVPLLWAQNIPMNFIAALPLNLLVAGPVARYVFRRAFPMGTVLQEPATVHPAVEVAAEKPAPAAAAQ